MAEKVQFEPVSTAKANLTACPDHETLRQLVADTLTVDAQLSEHLSQCKKCQALLDNLSNSGFLNEYRPWIRKRCATLPELESPSRPCDLGRLGDLAIESVLGRGGMGIVFRGRDLRLGREVAVKFVHPGSSPQAEERFTREARAIAALQHESIVPIYHIGKNSKGQDFIVLPLIRGQSLRARLAEHELSPRETAEIIRQIADALAAAHAAGLIHRDVKPDNILLDETDRRAKITDFGLVRITQETALTKADIICGTPEYISPEQATSGDQIDQRSDIYSLGVTMYECLTGSPPFRGRPLEVIDQHRLSSPLPPRRLNRLIPPELETICLKAMCKGTEDRFPSMIALRDDLQRFLDGKPILAKPVSSIQSLKLWCRRNPRLALALASTITSLALGTFVSSLFWLKSSTNERQSRRLADQLGRNEQQLQVALETSESQRVQAEKRFRELRKLANELVFEIYPQVEYLENSLAARQAIIASALKYLDELYQESDDDLQLQSELATAYEKIGELLGVTSNANLGDKESGLEKYFRARQLRQTVYEATPSDPEAIERLAHNHYIVGRTLWAKDDIKEAEQSFQTGIELQRKLVSIRPDENSLNKLAIILIDCAVIPSWDGNYELANEFYLEAQEILDRLIEQSPDKPEYQKTITRLLRAVSKVQSGLGKVQESEASLTKAIELGKALVDTFPGDFPVERSVWLSKYLLAELYIDSKAVDKVVPACLATIDFPKSVVEREPTNAFVSGDLANSYFNLARGYRLTEDFAASIREAQNALGVMEKLAASHPDDKEYQRNLAIYHNEIARGHLELKQFDECEKHISKSIEILSPMAESETGSLFNKFDLALALRVSSQAKYHLGMQEESLQEVNQTIRLIEFLKEAGLPQATDQLLTELQEERDRYSQSDSNKAF